MGLRTWESKVHMDWLIEKEGYNAPARGIEKKVEEGIDKDRCIDWG